ncbi:Thymocyte nuclear protein 1 [Ceratocystis fimbriata CBS 114723]|uniref:Thymocyte nuclear protein 1 n=1 Tax=Ceratocystis fimbriata CBS 114723 TaxID=1035309 RepID=A0A2C5X3N3_9PEZI|nr:Thymocyte nuclear protein 1 [Ceratocystis fimbriata CBS 114723]
MARKRAATQTETTEGQEPKRRASARLRGSDTTVAAQVDVPIYNATTRAPRKPKRKLPEASDREPEEEHKPQTPKLKTALQATAAPKPKAKSSTSSNSGQGLANSDANPDPDSLPEVNPEIDRHDGEWYFLMKAEPETRYENGIDVRFSIDDLRACKKPEPWDGKLLRRTLSLRSLEFEIMPFVFISAVSGFLTLRLARNNFKAMNYGDKAFFYHSNTKEPGIVGIMEVVREYSEDVSARRPGTAYYDPKSTKENPKWGLVHVRFVKKFAVPIGLQELRQLGNAGKLNDMQMLKQTRLSVSKVGQKEFRFLCDLADQKAKAAGLEHIV